jgi:hypothetical protein
MRMRTLLIAVVVSSLHLTSTSRRGQSQPRHELATGTLSARPADVEAAVALICAPTDIARSENGSVSGCRRCPDATDEHGGRIGDGWTLTNTMVGHFTSAQDENLILSGGNCDSEANNDGGSFVFLITSGKARLLNYDKGLITEECQMFFDATAIEFLVCRDGRSGGGEEGWGVFLARFSDSGGVTQNYFFTTIDTTGTCPDDASPQQKVQDSDIKSIKYVTKGPGELRAVTIFATQGKITCAQANAEIDEEPDVVGERLPRKEFPSVKTYEIHFLFDGKKLVVAPESRAAFRLFPKVR